MNCRRVEQRLSNHLESRLRGQEAAAVTVHLRDCPACRRLQDELLAAGAALRELAPPSPRADLLQRAVERWVAERQSAVRPTMFGHWGLSPILLFVAAAVVAAALGLGLTRW